MHQRRLLSYLICDPIRMRSSTVGSVTCITNTGCTLQHLIVFSILAATHLVRSYIRSLPALTPLALVLKQFLSERGLNNTYTGGLLPSSILLLI